VVADIGGKPHPRQRQPGRLIGVEEGQGRFVKGGVCGHDPSVALHGEGRVNTALFAAKI
jgi:hypothetical protein